MTRLDISTDNLIRLRNLRNQAAGGSYVNSGTITMTLYDITGTTPVSGQVFPATMTYIPGSNGQFEGVLVAGLALVELQTYLLVISISAGGLNKTIRRKCVAVFAGH